MVPEPTLDDISAAGARLLLSSAEWMSRLVETVVIDSEATGRRHLTMDVELPRDEGAAAGKTQDGWLYYLPLTMLGRRRTTAQIDLTDEGDRVLPLLTKAQNTEISWDALSYIFTMEKWLFEGFDDELQSLLLNTEAEADGRASASIAALVLMGAIPDTHPCAERLRNVIADLANNSVLWIPLAGRHGERRVVKLSYPITIRQPLTQYDTEMVEWALEDDHLNKSMTYIMHQRGGRNLQRTAAATVERCIAALGWAPYRVRVEFPQVRGPQSYHLQLVAPEGVDVGKIECGGSAMDFVVESISDGRCAHLYIKGAEPALDGFITCSYRPERRGFLNWALLATLVAACGLWLAQAHVPSGSKSDTDQQIAAAILLVLPALLVVLVIRQPEHPVATRLLSGVRALVMFSGLCSVTAAASLAGIQPANWQSTSEDWIWCAAGATLASIGVAAAWLSSYQLNVFTDMARERDGSHYFARTVLLTIGTGCALEWVRRNIVGLGQSEPTAAFALLALATLLAANTVVNTPHRVRFLRFCSATLTIVLVGAAGAILTLGAAQRTTILGGLELVVLAIALAAGCSALVVARQQQIVRPA